MNRTTVLLAIAIVCAGIGAVPSVAQALPPRQVVIEEVAPPGNDDFDAATVVTALPFDDSVDTRGATGAPDDPICDGQCGTVWYRFTPEMDSAVSVSTWGSDYDTRALVFTGVRGSLELVTVLWGATYRLAASAGTTYHFLITNSTYDLGGGHLRFSATDRPPLSLSLSVEPVAIMDKPSGTITFRGEITCSLPSQLYVGVWLERWLAKRFLRTGGAVVLACTAHETFVIEVQTFSASRFRDCYPPGHYTARARVDGWDTDRGEAAEASIERFPMFVPGGP